MGHGTALAAKQQPQMDACVCAGGHEMTSINVLIKINGYFYYHLLINKKENWPGFDVHK